MIQANELRIGNWLLTESGTPQQVAYIGETIGFHNNMGGTDKHQKNPIFSYDIEKIEPILLTPEILEKVGFEHSYDSVLPYQDAYENGYFILNAQFELTDKDGLIISKQIKYVHQLQNLYFTLTETELKIEL
jgi:hypothetical protein